PSIRRVRTRHNPREFRRSKQDRHASSFLQLRSRRRTDHDFLRLFTISCGVASSEVSLMTTYPRWLIETGLGEEAVKAVLGGERPAPEADHATWRVYWDQPVAIDQIRAIAARSPRPFWLYGDIVRMDQFSDRPPTRTLTAAEALEPVGP